ncbi:protein FAR1-RELATED SEQUENCE 5-like [Helianthus annuus]|uniref:protein FAR1-RELATED SEQUENCE 5-like n=1 Tax=Helianthus annuus TaxID=4232 RepID=UPI000B8F3C2A|nr:protein FAR1-RELATED SEQUENCE 5-like [Helianthus annuus]
MEVTPERSARYGSGIVRKSPRTGKLSYIPDVNISKRPQVGMRFRTVDEAYAFYENYAKLGGFTIRKNTQKMIKGIVTLKYFTCSKEGKKTYQKIDTVNDMDVDNVKGKQCRTRPSIRTGCLARLIVKRLDDMTYKINSFYEEHNHTLVEEGDYQFLSAARNLSVVQEDFIQNLSKLNIGPVQAFNIMRTHYGGFEEVGATAVDCKNLKRDINAYIGEHDAEMVVSRLMDKKRYLPDFSCEYLNDDKGELRGLFWADEEMKLNYMQFGDVIAFDSTFRSNKYDMVFVPFTGIDNHHKNVTFGAALLASETAESYNWLLSAFKKCYGREPRVVATDQDPAMKKAIREVFTTSRHRLCMWHIMKKVAEKVGPTLKKDKSFRQRICDIVWTDAIQPEDFEEKWKEIMSDFHLTGNKWLSDMYAIRNDWIPAYYRHENMSGLMRTTSRSESDNRFFGQFRSSSHTLVEFISHFETAIESQRYKHRKNDHDTRNTTPDWVTDLNFEREANEIYTRNIFNDLQHELLLGVTESHSMNVEQVGEFIKFSIKDLDVEGSVLREVLFREDDMEIKCSCGRYEQYGVLCRHIFLVLKMSKVETFPKKYVMRRWTRDAVPRKTVTSVKENAEANQTVDGVNKVVREIMIGTEYIVDKLSKDMEKLALYRDKVKGDIAQLDEICGSSQPIQKKDRIATLLGFKQPDKDTVRAPVGIRTKGCGFKKRIKSTFEQVSTKQPRKQRTCGICGSHEHDKRKCDKKPEAS